MALARNLYGLSRMWSRNIHKAKFNNVRALASTFNSSKRPFSTVNVPQNSQLSMLTDSSNLILTLAEIRRACNLKTGSNGTVVIGNQSSGKLHSLKR